MRIHCLQHEHFEGVANIGRWAESNGYPVTHTLFFGDGRLPDHDSYDCLLIMGGSMGAYEEALFPWLKEEKIFITRAIELGKTVLGICLGAQIVAEVIGGRVYKGRVKETGWLPVHTTPEGRQTELFGMFPDTFFPLQWHGDSFDLPRGATRLAFSAAYPNQAFQYGDRIVGLQFHLELAKNDVLRFLKYQRYGVRKGPYEQPREEIAARHDNFETNHLLLHQVLEALDRQVQHNDANPGLCLTPFFAEKTTIAA